MIFFIVLNVFICDKDTSAVLGKFLAGFYLSNKAVNFQNYFANKLILEVFIKSEVLRVATIYYLAVK